jgi:hypothetical protein
MNSTSKQQAISLNRKKESTMAEEEKEAPMHGDILEAILSHVPLVDLAPACHVSHTWKCAILSSLGRFNKIKPYMLLPYTFAYSIDPLHQIDMALG